MLLTTVTCIYSTGDFSHLILIGVLCFVFVFWFVCFFVFLFFCVYVWCLKLICASGIGGFVFRDLFSFQDMDVIKSRGSKILMFLSPVNCMRECDLFLSNGYWLV